MEGEIPGVLLPPWRAYAGVGPLRKGGTMPASKRPMAERRTARVPQKVIHRHRIGAQVFKRVSEFVVVGGQPKAILRWIDIAGVRAPIAVDLDPAKLRRISAGASAMFHYTGTTADPSTDPEGKPPLRGRRRTSSEPIPGGRRRTDPPLRGHPPK